MPWMVEDVDRFKIPGRQVFCSTLWGWVHEMAWIFIVMKLFRADIRAITEG
jgi:hypothetical protein